MFGLSGSGDGATVKNKPLMNEIAYGTHHPGNVHDIFYCTDHIEGGNTNNSMLIRDFMEGRMYEIFPRNELFDMINFDGAKVVQVAGKILEADHTNVQTSPVCFAPCMVPTYT